MDCFFKHPFGISAQSKKTSQNVPQTNVLCVRLPKVYIKTFMFTDSYIEFVIATIIIIVEQFTLLDRVIINFN